MRETLRELIDTTKTIQNGVEPQLLLFCDECGQPLSREVEKLWHHLAKEHGIRRITKGSAVSTI
jgi:hypothetical protein